MIRHRGVPVLLCDFSGCTRESGKKLQDALLERLGREGESSVRLFVDAHNATHDATQGNEWKRHLDLYNFCLKKTAVVGVGALNRIALAGLRTYARLMGKEKAIYQIQVFDSRESALDYLVTDK